MSLKTSPKSLKTSPKNLASNAHHRAIMVYIVALDLVSPGSSAHLFDVIRSHCSAFGKLFQASGLSQVNSTRGSYLI